MKVLLAHTLKPPTESRIYWKLGSSLSLINNLKVRILGSKGFEEKTQNTAIEKFGIFDSAAGFWARIFNLFRFWNESRKFKPDVLVMCSPDLLIPAILYKFCFGSKLIFDVQENFELNIEHQQVYSGFRFYHLVANLYFSILSPFIDRFWLAERVYASQLILPLNRWAVFENKVPAQWNEPLDTGFEEKPVGAGLIFVFSGVITIESGVLDAIDFFLVFMAEFPDSKLRIAGYVPSQFLMEKLKNIAIQNEESIFINIETWQTGRNIHEFIQKADAILVTYKESLANLGKIPTKVYESLFAGKPVVSSIESHYFSFLNRQKACIPFNPKGLTRESIIEIHSQIRSYRPLFKKGKQYIFDEEGLKSDFLALGQNFGSKFRNED